MIALLAAVVLLQAQSLVVMSPYVDDRLTAEAFRVSAELAPGLLAEASPEEPVEMDVVGGKVRMTRGRDASGRSALLLTPVPGTGARQNQACRITEIRPEGRDNTARALQWCKNTLGTAMIVVPRG
jgi:hypothetical protein